MDDDLMCGNDIRPEAPPLSVLHKGFVDSIIILVSSLYHFSLFPPLKDSDFHFSISGSKYLRALMVNRSSSRPDFSPLRPDAVVGSLTAVTRASALKTRFINPLPG